MSLTDRYVSPTGTDTYANSVSTSTPMSLTTALANAAAGDRINIKAGTYTRTGSDTPTNSGTVGQPIVYRGVDASWNPITPSRTNGNGPLDTTNFPLIDYSGTDNARVLAGAKSYLVFDTLNLKMSAGAGALALGTSCVARSCNVLNIKASAAAHGIDCQSGVAVVVDCDAACTGASTGNAVIVAANGTRIVGGRFKAAAAAAISVGSICTVAFATFYGSSYGIDLTSANSSQCLILNPTFYGITNDCLRAPNNVAWNGVLLVVNAHGTDSGRFFNSQYVATGNLPACLVATRTRDNTSADQGYGDWPVYGAVTTDTGTYTTDYSDAPNGDFRLISSAPGKAAGVPLYLDIGACQRQESGGSSSVNRGILSGGRL